MNHRVDFIAYHSSVNAQKRILALGILALAAASCVSTSEINQTEVTPEPSAFNQADLDIESSDSLPDLIMEYSWNVIYTSSCPWGGPGYVIMRGRNIGAGDAASFYIRVWDQLRPVDGLPPGEQVDVRAEFDSGPVGSIPAFIDSENQVEESDEENNEVLIMFTPPPRCTPEAGG